MCSALRLDDMHASLPDLKYRSPPLWWSIVIGCLLFFRCIGSFVC
jgi:hypothetical protein